ncbi:hypothetical protein GF314_03345 [bacterium]|nr:hypothetical protein [bacterium]
MTTRTTLLVSHKGVDLHAATAVRVMQRRLEDGDALHRLARCELHTFTDDGERCRVTDLLEIGRYFNPNKHHYGHFEWTTAETDAFDDPAPGGATLAAAWPGEAVASDTDAPGAGLYERLLGGPVPEGCVAVDLAAMPLGDHEVVRSGVLWRLVLADDGRAPERLAERLAIARSGVQGLLVNPHLDRWLIRVQRAQDEGGPA